MNKPIVIDIYHGDPVEDFQAVKDFGIVGVIHKATEGTGGSDPLYDIRRKAFTAIGMKWGAYHFMHDGNGTAQADHFLEVAKPDADTLLACDWENNTSGGGYPSVQTVKDFCQRIYDKLGRWPVLYSGNVAKEALKGKDPFFANLRLWLCQYGLSWHVQPSWTTPWLWQQNGDTYGPGPHQIPGIKGNCDNNCLVDPMTVDQLLAEWAT
jgi:lysozyme